MKWSSGLFRLGKRRVWGLFERGQEPPILRARGFGASFFLDAQLVLSPGAAFLAATAWLGAPQRRHPRLTWLR